MGSPNSQELEVLITIAKSCNYVLETGSGFSTQCFAVNNVKVATIDLFSPEDKLRDACPGVTFMTGWSITDSDMIKLGDPLFNKSRYKDTPDEKIAYGIESMTGETDLIRKALEMFGVPDLFFCDTGEYCGYAEWRIMRDIIPVGGFIALHDIHYPKSVKNFLAYREILAKPDKWELLYKSMSRQGLCIARRIA